MQNMHQSHQSPSKARSRPRTRAWVKQQEEEEKNAAIKANVSKPLRFSRRLALKQGKTLKDSPPSANRRTVPDPGAVASRSRGQRRTLARTTPPAKSSKKKKGVTLTAKGPLQGGKGEGATVSINFAGLWE